jgi:hypothetical protein
MLLEMGGDMEGTDEFGRTRLVHAVISGHEKTAKVFISPSIFSSGYHILYLSFPIFLSHLKYVHFLFLYLSKSIKVFLSFYLLNTFTGYRNFNFFLSIFIKVLIEAGADVNTVFESQYERMELEIDGKKKEINLKSYPGISSDVQKFTMHSRNKLSLNVPSN